MTNVIRTATTDDYEGLGERFASSLLVPFHSTEAGRGIFEPDRTLVAEDGTTVTGTTRALSRTLSVPGGVVPAAHVTGVAVAATHRRRGIMTDLMRHQLSRTPEPLAVLWAIKPGIYERFGYQAAAYSHRLTADLVRIGQVAPPPPGELREVTAAEAATALPPLLDEYQRTRPGVSGRQERHWASSLADPSELREGRTARQFAVYYSVEGTPQGYVAWRGKLDFGQHGPAAEIGVEELVAVSEAAYRALWRYVLTMDLATSLVYRGAGADEAVGQLVTNPRGLGVHVSDSLWVRITDVAAALSKRRYATDVDVVLEVTDEFLPSKAGRFRLTGGPESARCVETGDAADLSMSIGELSGAYLGGRRLSEFAAVGKVVEHRPGTLAAATAAFGWVVAPTAIEVF